MEEDIERNSIQEKSVKINNLKEYLKRFSDYYEIAMKKIGIEIDIDKLKNLIEEMEYEYIYDEKNSGTFNVSQVNKKCAVIGNNFEKNGNKRNNFLLLHECTHLTSSYNKNIFSKDLNSYMMDFDNFESIKATQNTEFVLGGYDVIKGLIAIEEVIAQWLAERANEAINGVQNKIKHEEVHNILGTKLKIKTDFSDNDFYAPLEERVEDMAINMGFKNIDDFIIKMYNGDKDIFEYINDDTVKTIGCIGILCQGIYQENGLEDCGLPSTDIKNAVKYLDSKTRSYQGPDL